MGLLEKSEVVLVVVDVQGKLAQLMWNREGLFAKLATLIRGFRVLELPVLWLEQVPEKLGPTVTEIRECLSGFFPIAKQSFSGAGCPEFMRQLDGLRRHTIVLAGIEAHVCVYQTAIELLGTGYRVEIVADAVSSRSESDRRYGLRRLRRAGAGITSVEMLLFELQRVAAGDHFRQLSKLVR